MLNKLLSLVGLVSKSRLEKGLQVAEQEIADAIAHEQKHQKISLDILEKQYNEELKKLAAENDALKRENDSLLEDVALALLGRKTKGAKSTVQVSKAKELKHGYDPKKPVAKSTARQMIKKLEEKLKTIPDGARGTGGIDVVVNGEQTVKSFSSKEELQSILKDAKAGKIEIAPQAGL